MKHLFYAVCAGMLLASCSEYTVIPQYVSVQELNSLEAGMTKAKVVESLGAEPFDAFHSSENGCEVYSFKYAHIGQEIKAERKFDEASLRGGIVSLTDIDDVYLYFNGGLLTDLITDDAFDNASFVADLEAACDGPVSGCTDITATNYNEDAQIDDDSCEYCPCGYSLNPDYDADRGCGEQCIADESEDDSEKSEEEECSLCDLVEKSNGNVTLNVTTGQGSVGSVERASNSRGVSRTVRTSSSEQASSKAKGASKSEKRLAAAKKALAESEAKDGGKESRQTQILRKQVEKLEAKQ